MFPLYQRIILLIYSCALSVYTAWEKEKKKLGWGCWEVAVVLVYVYLTLSAVSKTSCFF